MLHPPGWCSSEHPLSDLTWSLRPCTHWHSLRKASFHLKLLTRELSKQQSTLQLPKLRVPYCGAAPQAANQQVSLSESGRFILTPVNLTFHYQDYSLAQEPCITLADLGGVPGECPPPYGTKFFHFCIHFCRKVPASGVHALP